MEHAKRLNPARRLRAAAAALETRRRSWMERSWMEDTAEEHRRAERAALAGREVLYDHLKVTPHRTLLVSGLEFQRFRSLAKTGRRFSLCCLPVASPVGGVATWWAGITNVTDLVYTAFMVALSVAFERPGKPNFGDWLTVMNMIGSAIYILDLIMGFHQGVVVRWDSRAVIVLDGRMVARYYMGSDFWLDLIATVPSVVQVIILASGIGAHSVRIVYILRLLRLVRVARLVNGLQPGSSGGSSGPLKPLVALLTTRTLLLFNAGLTLAVLVNLLGCLWWNLAISQGIYHSWASPDVLTTKKYNLAEASDWNRWLVSCYYSLTTMLTIGYGDITPVTILETGVVIIFQVVGVGYFGFLLNTITSIMAASGPRARRRDAVRCKLQDVDEVMAAAGLGAHLRQHIRQFYMERWQPARDFNVKQMYGELPPRLRVAVARQRQEPALDQLHLLPPSLAPKQRLMAQKALAAASAPALLQAGQLLSEASYDPAPEEAGWWGVAPPPKTGPFCYLLDEGEMRALQPGSSSRRQQLSGSSTSDFYGPAMIGLSGLFSVLPPDSDGDADGGKEGSSGGGKEGSDGGGKDCNGSGVGGRGSRAGSRGSSGGGVSRSKGGGGSKDCGSSGSSGSSGSEGEDEDIDSESEADLDYHWQQEALALTHCRLWRIDCQQLYRTLRDQQPGVLLFMLRRLLQSLGVPEAATSGAGVMDELPAPPLDPPPPGSRRLALVQRLLGMCRELEAAERAQPAASASKGSHQSEVPSWRADSLSTSTDSLRVSFGPRGSIELESVDVGGPAGHLTADVLHTGE
ncbi:Potassium channel AKT1 [Chlorella sorokiniana]|uniref:Potassium channel AKT1 n=1 Tax=Chlorella sorokiniana TaxID=3076 RepID=A0A2P6TTE7_CHLSO|nr:Potassium channel AKT1 [Chlorella sorokiniana]|eukprot:PRW57335.1 Potassium channel AKT1 [Chlorella sorokiniana]